MRFPTDAIGVRSVEVCGVRRTLSPLLFGFVLANVGDASAVEPAALPATTKLVVVLHSPAVSVDGSVQSEHATALARIVAQIRPEDASIVTVTEEDDVRIRTARSRRIPILVVQGKPIVVERERHGSDGHVTVRARAELLLLRSGSLHGITKGEATTERPKGTASNALEVVDGELATAAMRQALKDPLAWGVVH
jgi:hypothetical protein